MAVIVRSAESASIVAVEKPVRETADDPNARTETRSAGGLAAINARAAAVASVSAAPVIDCERSIAITTLRRADVRRRQAGNGPAVLRQAGSRRRRRRSDDRNADAREIVRVDRLDLPRRQCGRSEDEDGKEREKDSSDWNPPKLAAVKLGLKFGSSCWKNVAGRVTPFAASFSRK